MPTKVLTPTYKPQFEYNSKEPHNSDLNKRSQRSTSGILITNVHRSAKAYKDKHPFDEETKKRSKSKPKLVTITQDDIYNRLMKTNGRCELTGEKLYFPPAMYWKYPGLAVEFGFCTDDDLDRRPSVDRIDSNGDYTPDNIQITTLSANRGKNKSKKTKPVIETPLVPMVISDGKMSVSTSLQMNEASASFIAEILANYTKIMNT